jgi:uncharacterized membrane protein
MMRPRRIIVLLYIAAIVHLGWIASQMPDRVATHYDGAGNPNGWMTRGGMVGFQLLMLAITAAAFVGLPLLLGRLSPKLINIPNREYWLSPERRAASVAALQNWMAVQGSGVVILMMAVTGLLHHANQVSPPRLSPSGLLASLAAFLLFVGGSIVALYRRFPRPPAAQRT